MMLNVRRVDGNGNDDDNNHRNCGGGGSTSGGGCYCSIIQEKHTKVVNNFLTHTALSPLDDEEEGGISFGKIHHQCHLKATHTLDSYFTKKIEAPHGSKEEYDHSTFPMMKSMNHVIDSLSIDGFQREYYALEMAKMLPSMFNLHQLAVCCNRMTRNDFNRWYNDKIIYNERRKAIQLEDMLRRDNTFIFKEEEPRETITITDVKKDACLEVTLENFVFSTHCENENTGDDYAFNLSYIAIKLLPCGIQLTKTKFAKIDVRTLWGSLLIFRDGSIIETGAKKAEISAKLRQHTINKLKYDCGYKNLGIRSSKIENVVVTAKTNFKILLPLLKHKYNFVTYLPGPDSFSGAIIRMSDVDEYLKTHPSMYSFIDYEDDDDDEYEIKESSYDRKRREKESIIKMEVKVMKEEDVVVTEPLNMDKIKVKKEFEYEEEDEEEEDEYLEISDDDDTIIKREEGGGGNMVDREMNENLEDYVKYLQSKKGSSSTDDKENGKGKNNATTLLFDSASISVGFKSRKTVKNDMAKLFPFFESARDSPENLEQLKRLQSSHSLSTTGSSSSSYSRSKDKRKRKSSNTKKNNNNKRRKETV